MKNFSKVLIVAVLGVLGADATAEPIGCKGCDPPKQEDSHREQIKADRAKYDRENEKTTARPWDVVKGDKLPPEKSK
jgi:hypothetical protein